jgi:hypothetical protein
MARLSKSRSAHRLSPSIALDGMHRGLTYSGYPAIPVIPEYRCLGLRCVVAFGRKSRATHLGVKNLTYLPNKQLRTSGESETSREAGSREEMNRRLLELLGEVIRMSQAWVRALESGDPFTADKCEAECVAAMERFETNRERNPSSPDSLEQTQ